MAERRGATGEHPVDHARRVSTMYENFVVQVGHVENDHRSVSIGVGLDERFCRAREALIVAIREAPDDVIGSVILTYGRAEMMQRLGLSMPQVTMQRLGIEA